MTYDFETLVPAIDAESPMRSKLRTGGFPDEMIDYGVAEMKFKLFPEMKSAILGVTESEILGYVAADQSYYDAVCGWMKRRHGWDVLPEEIYQTYGVVESIGICIRAVTAPGDNILIQSPVYNPFAAQIRSNGRNVIENELVFKNGRYEIDFSDFEEKAKKVSMFILCSPHNPVGRVWTREELSRISEICLNNGVTVLSDEIHSDIVYRGKHTPFAVLSEKASENCIVCTAPSKTFNIPGLITSNTIIKNKSLREACIEERDLSIGHFINPIGTAACRAAYLSGDEWVDELCSYIAENASVMKARLAEKVPGAVMADMEGTYLAWIDLGFTGLFGDELEHFIKKEALLPVNMGAVYGGDSSGFIRVNIGCPRRYVEAFVDKLAEALSRL